MNWSLMDYRIGPLVAMALAVMFGAVVALTFACGKATIATAPAAPGPLEFYQIHARGGPEGLSVWCTKPPYVTLYVLNGRGVAVATHGGACP